MLYRVTQDSGTVQGGDHRSACSATCYLTCSAARHLNTHIHYLHTHTYTNTHTHIHATCMHSVMTESGYRPVTVYYNSIIGYGSYIVSCTETMSASLSLGHSHTLILYTLTHAHTLTHIAKALFFQTDWTSGSAMENGRTNMAIHPYARCTGRETTNSYFTSRLLHGRYGTLWGS